MATDINCINASSRVEENIKVMITWHSYNHSPNFRFLIWKNICLLSFFVLFDALFLFFAILCNCFFLLFFLLVLIFAFYWRVTIAFAVVWYFPKLLIYFSSTPSYQYFRAIVFLKVFFFCFSLLLILYKTDLQKILLERKFILHPVVK